MNFLKPLIILLVFVSMSFSITGCMPQNDDDDDKRGQQNSGDHGDREDDHDDD